MNKNFALTVAMLSALSLPVIAQSPTPEPPSKPLSPEQRYDDQQGRIAAGIKDGQLTPSEAAKLEAEETRLKNKAAMLAKQNGGKLTPAEQQRLNNIQNRLSHQIKVDEANGSKTAANPSNPLAKTEQNQQDRIAQGVASGQLTSGEAATLEKQESQLNHEIKTDRQANGGTLTQAERQQVRQQQKQLSKEIYRDKHNNQRRNRK